MQKFKIILSKKKVWIPTGLLLVFIAGGFFFNNGNGKNIAVAKRADVIQQIAVAGKVKPNQDVDLGFERSGRVSFVNAGVGDLVGEGQVLVSLDSAEILADLAKARAFLESEMVELKEIKSTAPASYSDALTGLQTYIKDGFATADDAVRNKADQFFTNIPNNPQFEVSIVSGNFVHYFDIPNDKALEINTLRKNAEKILNDWQARLNLDASSNLAQQADLALDDLNKISIFLDKIAAAVNTFVPAEYAYDTTVSGYKTTIYNARSAVSGAISSIVTAKDKLNSAPVLNENGQFGDVLTQESAVNQAAASVAALEASLEKSSIRAPFYGVVTVQDAKIGGMVSVGTPLVSIISRDGIYIEANVSEIHIGKVSVGNQVSVTFDAFPGEKFEGEVSYIEPGDILIDGIVNYKIRVTLKNFDPKIKSGLTSNLEIQTNRKTNVLTLPIYAVKNENGQDFIYKIIGKKTQKTPVTLGISGNDGLVEILSGDLREGDNVEF